MSDKTTQKPISCPSAQPEYAAAVVFGVMTGTPESGLRLSYLTEAVPVTDDLLATTGEARPTEVLRIAAPCVTHSCRHYDGANCQLATRVASMLDPVVGGLPRCAIRATCRWFRQEGRAACVRCPQIATQYRNPTEHQREVAG